MHKMSMMIEAHTVEDLKVEDIGTVTFGGFSFCIDDEYIPFDYEAFTTYPYQREDGKVTLEYVSGRGFLFNEYTLDSSYEDMYDDMDLNIEDIDAKMLSKVSIIEELFHELYHKDDKHEEKCYDIIIDSITFVDLDDWENKVEYPVAQEVIDAYNQKESN